MRMKEKTSLQSGIMNTENTIWNIYNSRLLNQAFSVDSSFSHFSFCTNLICVARARRVPHTPVVAHFIHPPVILEGSALKQRSPPAARTAMKGTPAQMGSSLSQDLHRSGAARNCLLNPISAVICLSSHGQVANSPLSSRSSGRAPKASKEMSWACGVCIRLQVGI